MLSLTLVAALAAESHTPADGGTSEAQREALDDRIAWMGQTWSSERPQLYEDLVGFVDMETPDELVGLAAVAPPEVALGLFQEAARLSPGDPVPYALLGVSVQGGWSGFLALDEQLADARMARHALMTAYQIDRDDLAWQALLLVNAWRMDDQDWALSALTELHGSTWIGLGDTLLDRSEDLLDAAGMLDAQTAEGLYWHHDQPIYAELEALADAALPDPDSDLVPLQLAEARAEALVTLGKAMGDGTTYERARAPHLVRQAGDRLAVIQGAYEADVEQALAWSQEGGELQAELSAWIDAGYDSPWQRALDRSSDPVERERLERLLGRYYSR